MVYLVVGVNVAFRFMAASKVLGEETVSGANGNSAQSSGAKQGEK